MSGRAQRGHAVAVAVAVGIVVAIAARAWICDDAAITARTVDNLLHGYGLRWNVGERVQAYTHPSWMLLQIVPTMVLGWYWGLVVLGLACSAAAVGGLLIRPRGAVFERIVVGVGLLGSMAFLDYGTSGLENPLANLLLVGWVAVLHRPPSSRRALGALVLVALLMLTRLDLVLLVAPATLVLVARLRARGWGWRRLAVLVGLGSAPWWAWEVFSLVYYGFWVPNTAYAKLGAEIPLGARLGMGLDYLGYTVRHDPVTLVVQAVWIGVLLRRRGPWDLAVAGGVLAYDLYVLYVGGDFMGGRFWVAPLCAAGAGVVFGAPSDRTPGWGRVGVWAAAVATATGLAVATTRNEAPDFTSVVDERAQFVAFTGIAHATEPAFPDHPWIREGRAWARRDVGVVHAHAVGLRGLYAGPGVHVIDHLALTDPLLARLPAAWDESWRPGHYERMGQWNTTRPILRRCPNRYEVCRFWRRYQRSVETGRCELEDPDLCAYWADLRRITEGPVFSAERWEAIVAFHLGRRDHLIDVPRYRMAARAYQSP